MLIWMSLHRVLKAKMKTSQSGTGASKNKSREKTIEAMVRIYCKNHHESKGELCPECSELLEYAKMRLDKCPFKRRNLHAASPRMLLHHPVLAIHHIIDGRKKPEKLTRKTR
jgi:hypothetical protein